MRLFVGFVMQGLNYESFDALDFSEHLSEEW